RPFSIPPCSSTNIQASSRADLHFAAGRISDFSLGSALSTFIVFACSLSNESSRCWSDVGTPTSRLATLVMPTSLLASRPHSISAGADTIRVLSATFAGKTVLGAGGRGGLGRAVSLAFLAAGAEVTSTFRNPAEAEELAAAAGGDAGRLTTRALDVTDEAAVRG